MSKKSERFFSRKPLPPVAISSSKLREVSLLCYYTYLDRLEELEHHSRSQPASHVDRALRFYLWARVLIPLRTLHALDYYQIMILKVLRALAEVRTTVKN